jgi:DNA-directed RNA polymerase specialized sigma24 family protein
MIECKEDTDDIVQDLCLMVVKKEDFFNSMDFESQKAFLLKCAKNKVVDRHRKFKRSFDANLFTNRTEPNVYGIIRLKEVLGFLDKKRSSSKSQLLDFAHGYSLNELTKEYNVTLNQAMARHANIRIRLRKNFKKSI